MAKKCPNKNLDSWKELEKAFGTRRAYGIWNETDGEVDQYLKISPTAVRRTVDQFIKTIGFSVEPVRAIFNKWGSTPVAEVNMATGIINVVEGKQAESTLPEEASHIMVEFVKQKNDKLYRGMLAQARRNPMFQEVWDQYKEVYEWNSDKVAEETAGKLLAEYWSGAKVEPFWKLWWNNVKSWLKSVLPLNSEQSRDYFREVADWMFTGDLSGFVRTNLSFYQLDPLIAKLDREQNRFTKIETDAGQRYVEKATGRQIKLRVSDRVEKAKAGKFPDRTADQKIMDNFKRETGLDGHAAIQDMVEQMINPVARVKVPDTTTYNKLQNYLVDLMNAFPAGTVFRSEQPIYDEVEDEVGTIDLMVIEPNGKTHIFDWKFIEFRTNEKGKIVDNEVSKDKRDAWAIQLNRYRKILQQRYNISPEKLGFTRVIPIAVTYDGDTVKGIDIGPVSLKSKKDNTKPHLDPVPTTEERTGDELLDRVIEQLSSQLRIVKGLTPKGEEDYRQKYVRQNEIADAIKDIQLRKSAKSLSQFMIQELGFIERNYFAKPDEMTDEQMRWALSITDFFLQVRLPELESARQRALVIQDKLKGPSGLMEQWLAKRNINGIQQGMGWMDRLIPVTQAKNKILQFFGKRKEQVYDDAYAKVTAFNTKIQGYIDQLTGDKPFDAILQKKDGKYTGKLITKLSPEFYEKFADKGSTYKVRDKVRQINDDGSYSYVAAKDWYNQRKKSEEKWAKDYYKDENGKTIQSKVDDKMRNFEFKYNVFSTDSKIRESALKNQFNPLREVKEEFWSAEYKALMNRPETDPIRGLYDEFTRITDLANKWGDAGLPANFIPSIEKKLVRSLVDHGTNLSGFGANILDNMTFRDYERDVDAEGKPIYKIPLKYTQELGEKKDLDLGYVFSQFANSVFMNKALQQIEDESHLLLSGLKQSQFYTKDGRGRTSKSGNPTVTGDAESEKQLEEYINSYVYGKSGDTADTTFEFLGKQISVDKVRQEVQSYVSQTVLGFNTLSAVTNLTGGLVNAISFNFLQTKYFANADFGKALLKLGSRDSKSLALVNFMDVRTDLSNFDKARDKLATDKLQYATADWLYVLQQGGEFAVQNGVMLAMMKTWGIKDNKLVKVDNVKDSLWETTKLTDGKIDIPGLNAELFAEFRRKVRGVNMKVMGGMSEREILLAQQTVIGQLLLQFRKWVLPLGTVRFSSLRYNSLTDELEEGRYRTALKMLFAHIENRTKQLVYNIPALTNAEIREQMWQRAIDKNPDLNFPDVRDANREKFDRLITENIKSLAGEVSMYAGIVSFMFAVRPDDDDDRVDKYRAGIFKIMDRTARDLSFFMNPESFYELTKMSIPLLGFGLNALQFFKESGAYLFGNVTDNEELIEDSKPRRSFAKLVPIANSVQRIMDSIADEDE